MYLVRHGKAGERGDWEGPDSDRPLSKRGRRQADGLWKALGKPKVRRVLSSPAVRCQQTVAPLAHRNGLRVEPREELAEGAPIEPLLHLLEKLPDDTVLCSHGDVIPELVRALARRGVVIDGQPDWRKGATWILERDDHAFTRAHAVAPADAPGES